MLTLKVNGLTPDLCKVADMAKLPRDLQSRALLARTRMHLGPQEAADAIGCSRPTVLRWEKDARSIGPENLFSAARVYQVHPQWLALEIDDDHFPWAGTNEVREGSVQYAVSGTEPREDHPILRPTQVRIRGTMMPAKDGFASELRESELDERVDVFSKDPAAYAVRIVGNHYKPVIFAGECILVEPDLPLRQGRRALLVAKDGRHAVVTYLGEQHGFLLLADVRDANATSEIPSAEVQAIYRISSVFEVDA